MEKEKTGKGRPGLSEDEQESRKSLIIQIAKTLFLKDGYQAVSMRKIAAEANLSPMTIYQSFKNKREILRFIWADIFIAVTNQCQIEVKYADDDIKRFRAFCSAFLNYWLAHPDHYRVVYLESDKLEGNNDTFFVTNEVVASLFDQLCLLVSSIAYDQSSVEQNVKLLVLQLQGLAHGLNTIDEYPWGDPKILLDNCLAMFEKFVK
jgi:AcrR family transcriptional regulator